VAAIALFLVNNSLTDIAVALKVRIPVHRQLIGDFRYQLTTSGVLLALAPVTAIAVQGSVWTLPLLLLPIAAVHRSARLAYVREHEALHDALTGLANRALFNARLERACADSHRHALAVLLIDVDHFKEINDTLGHHAGDLMLREIAVRLEQAVREGDLVARLGGDEFAVLVSSVTTPGQLQPILDRVSKALHGSVVLSGVRVDVSASVGVALAPADADEAEMLLQRADVALYAAKRNRGSTMYYESQNDDHSVERLSLLGELRRGIASGEVFLVYQPKVSLTDDTVTGVEALVRWDHPVLGTLGPSRFIPLAENTGLIDTMTIALLDLGLQQLSVWHDEGRPLTLAVNLSARLLTDRGFVDAVAGCLARHDIAPHWLTLEVTESMIMADTDNSFAVMQALRDSGVRIAIDDFGTGYSSLAYLKRLAVDELKIDRTFVTELATDHHDAMIAQIAIELGHHFGLSVVAEGVEDAETMVRLRQLGCDIVQGFHIAHPMRPEPLRHWLDARRSAALVVREAV
jgi:diguanylate cyclase (GGDEF)-like protein